MPRYQRLGSGTEDITHNSPPDAEISGTAQTDARNPVGLTDFEGDS